MVENILGSLGLSLAQQDEKRRRRQATELAVAEKKARVAAAARDKSAIVTRESMLSAGQSREKQLEVLGGVNQQVEIAKQAIALSDSDNPLDRLKLWMLQQSNPSFTREGNLERINYLQSAAAAEGGIEALRQQGYADSLQTIENAAILETAADESILSVIKLQETQGQELIDAHTSNLAVTQQTMATQDSIQQLQLSKMTAEEVQQTYQSMKAAGVDTATVDGVDIPAGKMEERVQAMQDREYNMFLRNQQIGAIALSNVTAAELPKLKELAMQDPNRQVQIGNASVSLAQIQARELDVMTQDVTTLQLRDTQIGLAKKYAAEADKRVLQTMNVPELNQLALNNGVDSSGYQYDLGAVVGQLEVKRGLNNAGLAQQFQVASIGDPLTAIANRQQALGAIQAEPGTQLAEEIARQRSVLSVAATTVESSKGDPRVLAETMTTVSQVLTGGDEAIQTAVAAEAKRKSNGDPLREQAYKHLLIGQPIPQEIVQQALSENMKKGRPVGDWLSPETRGVYLNAYREYETQIKMEYRNAGMPLSAVDADSLAHDAGIKAVQQKLGSNVTDQLMAAQTRSGIGDKYGNPLYGVLTAGRFLATTRQADIEGADLYAKALGISPEELAKRPPDSQLMAYQSAALIRKLEEVKPGLGNAYAAWWGSEKKNGFVETFAAQQQFGGTTLGEKSEASIMAGLHTSTAEMIGASLSEGSDLLYQSQLQEQHANYVLFGGNPVNKQVYLLEQDPSLTPAEKQQAMTEIIIPILNLAKEQNLDPSTTTAFLETNLRDFKSEDARLNGLLKKMLKYRPTAMKAIDDFANQSQWFTSMAMAGGNPSPTGEGVAKDLGMQVEGFKWWNEIRAKVQ